MFRQYQREKCLGFLVVRFYIKSKHLDGTDITMGKKKNKGNSTFVVFPV